MLIIQILNHVSINRTVPYLWFSVCVYLVFSTFLNLGSNDLNILSYRIDIQDILQNIVSISYRLGTTNIDTALGPVLLIGQTGPN